MENTYLSTFRAWAGWAWCWAPWAWQRSLLRNVLERRRELALLRAVGYRPRHLAAMVLAENVLLLLLGLATGRRARCWRSPRRLLARRPFAVVSLGVLLAAGAGDRHGGSAVATAAALRSPLLDALRSE